MKKADGDNYESELAMQNATDHRDQRPPAEPQASFTDQDEDKVDAGADLFKSACIVVLAMCVVMAAVGFVASAWAALWTLLR